MGLIFHCFDESCDSFDSFGVEDPLVTPLPGHNMLDLERQSDESMSQAQADRGIVAFAS